MIYEKLANARVQLQSMKLKKSGKNKFAGFSYYELADFLPAINKIFLDLKICSNFSINESIATLTVTDWEDNTKEVFTSPIESLELKGCTKIQALGGVHTYLKRYLYLNALEIVENDMLDPTVGQNIDNDLDIFEGLKATDTPENTLAYYRENKDKVNDKKRFETLYKQRYLKLKKEVRNGENNN